ncbi:MAG: tyrosine-type recombinase/integrase [Oscillospiraceae bacterium]|nr:tyrosine-type recombinase/integrase [Oscillospiraceae bacterium]
MNFTHFGIYQTLLSQAEKLRKHNRQGSIKTKERYFQAMQRFCRYLASEWRLQKLSNIAPKHIEGYAEFLKQSHKSPSTIKTDLAAIRFYHDLISKPRYELPDNSSLKLSRRKFLGFDRTWSNVEFNLMLNYATKANREDYVCAMYLAYYAGLRIHECCRIDTATAENALKSGVLAIKGKNGKIRTVTINEIISFELRTLLDTTERGAKLFVPNDMPTHIYIKQLQHFISYHRDKLPPRDDKERLTFHGLRHTFALNKYNELMDRGYTDIQAKREVSKLLGHERADVTRIYLSGVGKERGGGE